MLTAAQQKVKQELEELQVTGRIHLDDVTPKSSHPMSKRATTIIGILVLIIFCSLFIKDYLFQRQERMTAFLTKEQDYDSQSKRLLDDSIENNNDDFQQAELKQAELLKQLIALDPPTSFNDYKQDLIAVMEKRLAIFTYLTETKNLNTFQLNKYLIELQVKQELATDSLIRALDRENIKYIRHEDGTVQYWIKSKSYQI